MEIKRPQVHQPMSEDAKKVFEGIIYDVYHWKQEQFDGSFKTFEKIKRKDTVQCVVVKEDRKIVLLKQYQPGWKQPKIGLAGGAIEKNQNVLEALEYELLEETRFRAKEFILFDSLQPMERIDWAVYTFIAKGCSKVVDLNSEAGEKIELIEVDFDEFIDFVIKPNFRDVEFACKVMQMLLGGHKEILRELIVG